MDAEVLDAMTLHLYLRTAAFDLAGEIADYTTFGAKVVANGMGSWALQMPANVAIADHIEWGGGVVLFKDQDQTANPVFSGPIGEITESVGDDGETLALSGPDDNYYLATRVITPTPSGPPYTEAYLQFVGIPADIVVGVVVAEHLAAPAAPERQLPRQEVEPPSGFGSLVNVSMRFDPMLDKLRSLAIEGGGFMFRNLFAWAPGSGGALYFRSWMPADRRAAVVFDVNRRTMKRGVYTEMIPKANYIYALGKGEGEGRAVVEGGDNESITHYQQRIEKVIDARAGDTAAELEQARDAALNENAAVVKVTVDPLETEAFQFGTDYDIGDRVSAVVRSHRFEGYVTALEIALDENGATITPVIEQELRL